jgi:hypothetical protein
MDEIAAAFIEGIRDGILHEAETEHGSYGGMNRKGKPWGKKAMNIRTLAQSCVDLEITDLVIQQTKSARLSPLRAECAQD